MVKVPLGLLIRCNPRNLPGVSPLPNRTVVLKWPELAALAIEGLSSGVVLANWREGRPSGECSMGAGSQAGSARGMTSRVLNPVF